MEIQVNKYPSTYALSDKLKAELDANPDQLKEGDEITFGYQDNPEDAAYQVVITWINKVEQ
ncbi:hypothetical protein [Desulfotruncus arcticus]|uniref:hypothetical protein n=1 Tax=Desulfotruncus arcticus TaxID=341036 RepID=UPI0013F4E5F1|nr:hypothetical protein [Desulfotruncus arcticus]